MTKKLFSAILFVILASGCSFTPIGDEISGPTVEPPIPPSGTVLFQDEFANPASGWERVNDANGIMDYDNGVYRILVNGSNKNLFATPGQLRPDARIEVDVVKIGGPDTNRGGIICRMSTVEGVTRFYFFVITNTGYFGIGRVEGERNILLGQSALAQSSAIKTGLNINHLRADCVGSALSFYVNGFLVSQVIDTTLTGGEAGLIVGTFDEAGVDMVFDEFIILQP